MKALARGRGRAARTVVALTVAAGLFALTGCAGTPAAPPPAQSAPETLHLPPIDVATIDWLNTLHSTLSEDPNFGSVAIDDTRSTVTVTWFGEVTPGLTALLAEAPDGIEVVVQPPDFPPGELQSLITRAMEPGAVPGIEVAMGYVANDGSGLHFGIVDLPPGFSVEHVAKRIADALDRTDVPIEVEVTGAIVPASG